MAEDVRIIITGRQLDEAGQEDITESRTTAQYYEKNGSHYIIYEERPEGEITPVRNIIKIKGSVLELTKRGDVNAHMVFEAGKGQTTDYITPYGIVKMEIFTRTLEISFKQEEMTVRAEYTLSSNGSLISDCVLTVLMLPLP